jgi:hypothetical protein
MRLVMIFIVEMVKAAIAMMRAKSRQMQVPVGSSGGI